MFCIDCGIKLPDRAKFCPICGTKAYIPPRSGREKPSYPQPSSQSSSVSAGDWNLRGEPSKSFSSDPDEEPPLSFFTPGIDRTFVNPSGVLSIQADRTHSFALPLKQTDQSSIKAASPSGKAADDPKPEKNRKKKHSVTVFLLMLLAFSAAIGILVGVLWYLEQSDPVQVSAFALSPSFSELKNGG